MADFLQAVGALEDFSPIFIFVLVLAVLYGLLQYTKLLGGSKALHALIAFVIALIFLFSQNAGEVIKIITPWFVLLFALILFLLVGIKMFGATKDAEIDLFAMFDKHSNISYWILAVTLVIVLGAIATVYSQPGEVLAERGDAGPVADAGSARGDTGSVGLGGFFGTITHPKVLGLIVILLIGSFTIRYMAQQN